MYRTMKLLRPAKLNSHSAFTVANLRSFELRTIARSESGRYGSIELPHRLCSRKTGRSAIVVAASTAAARRNGSGCQTPSRRPPASSAMPRPAPRAIACPACAYSARYGG